MAKTDKEIGLVSLAHNEDNANIVSVKQKTASKA